MPLVSRTFDQLIDFTRTSAGTYVDETGKIVSTPQSRNLLTFTQEFDNAAWVKASATVTANTTLAPNATNTADSLISTVGTGEQRVYRESLIPSTAGITYTFSVYAKANGANWLVVRDDWRGFADTSFDLVNGVVGTVASGRTAIITAAGNGWYRCSVTATVNASFVNGSVSLCLADADNGRASFSGNGTKAMFIWGAQLEQASSATDYTRNFGGLFPPRFDYDPVSLAPRGLLIEEQRSNLLLRSEEFDSLDWAKTELTVSANNTSSPTGTSSADKLIPTTVNSGTHEVAASPTVSTGIPYTYTVYAKAAGYNFLQVILSTGATGSGTFRNVNLATGALGAGDHPATVTNFGNGWYRVSITITPTTTTPIVNFNVQSTDAARRAAYAGNGTDGIFLWGAQLEAGAFATSYIPTVASQVTRTADVATIQAPNFAPWYNQSAGTFVVEFIPPASGGFNAATATDGTFNNRFQVIGANSFQFGVMVSGVYQALIDAGDINIRAVNKVAGAYRIDDFAASLNNSAVATDTAGSLPAVTRLDIGNLSGAAEFLNGHVRSVRYYPSRLTNAQLQALTA